MATEEPKLTAKQINEAAASSLKPKADASPEEPADGHKILVTTRSTMKVDTVPVLDTDTSEDAKPEPTAAPAPAQPEHAAVAPSSSNKVIMPIGHSNDTTKGEKVPEVAVEQTEEPATEQVEEVVEDKKASEPVTEAENEDEDEHSLKVAQLVNDGTYFLPINSLEKRRAKRSAFIGIVLVIVLGLAWGTIALDAGIIAIDGVKPVTHFFSG